MFIYLVCAQLSTKLKFVFQMKLVMPATSVISEWLSTPSINRLYTNMPSLDSLQTNLIKVDTWNTLANIANALVAAEFHSFLSRNISQLEGN